MPDLVPGRPRLLGRLPGGPAGSAAAATAADDQDALGWTHLIIGRYCTLIGVSDEDQVHLVHAMDHFRNARDLTGQAWASLNARPAANLRGDFPEAATP